MMAQVTVSEDGAVTATLDTSDEEVDEKLARLAGLTADDLMARVTHYAVTAWLATRADDAEADSDDDK